MDNENTLVIPPVGAPGIRTVDVNRAVSWLSAGFDMFKKAPGTWVLITIAMIVGSAILGWIGPDWMGDALSTIAGTVLIGVLMRACKALEEGRDILADAQATASLAPLWILGLIAAGLNVLLSLLGSMLGLTSLMAVLMNPGAIMHVLGFNFIIILLAAIALYMALWLAPALVVLRGVNPLDAIKLSLLGTLKNIVPYIVLSLLSLLLVLIAAIPLGLGLLVAIPMLICSSYLAYKDMFTA